jgi:hypothetical protein
MEHTLQLVTCGTCFLNLFSVGLQVQKQFGTCVIPTRRLPACLPACLPAAPIVFAGKSKQDLKRRASTGNWIADHVTFKEVMEYKEEMGYR